MTRHWLIADRDDPDARSLVDGETLSDASGNKKPHYSRQTPGARGWCRNGQNIVFMTADLLSVWCVHRPDPKSGVVRQDKRLAWENTMFRNENGERGRRGLEPLLSSILISEAVELTCALWGPLPPDGLITFVRPEKTTRKRSRNSLPGACYRHAGWEDARPASDGKPCLRAPMPLAIPPWSEWKFKGERTHKLRRQLEPIRPLMDLPLFRGTP